MPLYGSPQAGSDWVNPGLNITSVVPGDVPVFLFNNETPDVSSAPQASVSVAYATTSALYPKPPFLAPTPTFIISWATAPSAFSLYIQCSGTTSPDQDIYYINVTNVTTTPFTFTVTGSFATNRPYYRVRLLSNTGGVGLTVRFKP